MFRAEALSAVPRLHLGPAGGARGGATAGQGGPVPGPPAGLPQVNIFETFLFSTFKKLCNSAVGAEF